MYINLSEILGIDKVYCISLHKNNDKWDNLLKTITDNGFPNCVIFEGINGSQYSFENLENIIGIWQRYILKNNIMRTNHEQFNSWGGLGCYLSHIGIWQDAKDNGYKKILILEDDITFSENFSEKLSDRVAYIPKEYDLLFLDVLKCYSSKKINKYFNKILTLFFGTHSYIITSSAIDTMLKTAFPIEVQIDSYMSYTGNISDLNMYYTSGLCGQFLHLSDIQTVCLACDYKHSILVKPTVIVIIILLVIVNIYQAFNR